MVAEAAADPDKIDAKVAERLAWKPGDITITHPCPISPICSATTRWTS